MTEEMYTLLPQFETQTPPRDGQGTSLNKIFRSVCQEISAVRALTDTHTGGTDFISLAADTARSKIREEAQRFGEVTINSFKIALPPPAILTFNFTKFSLDPLLF